MVRSSATDARPVQLLIVEFGIIDWPRCGEGHAATSREAALDVRFLVNGQTIVGDVPVDMAGARDADDRARDY